MNQQSVIALLPEAVRVVNSHRGIGRIPPTVFARKAA